MYIVVIVLSIIAMSTINAVQINSPTPHEMSSFELQLVSTLDVAGEQEQQ